MLMNSGKVTRPNHTVFRRQVKETSAQGMTRLLPFGDACLVCLSHTLFDGRCVHRYNLYGQSDVALNRTGSRGKQIIGLLKTAIFTA
jgi:hypothetical protein